MFTHSQLRNPGAQCQISYSGCPGSAAPHPHYRPPLCRLLQQLFRWMNKVKAQPARVSPFLFEEEWASCHLLMHCLPLCMQTRQASSTVPPLHFVCIPKDLVQWLIRCFYGITGDMWEVCPPSKADENTPACWADVIRTRVKGGLQWTVDPWPPKSGS